MFSWLLNRIYEDGPEIFDDVVEGLKKIYRTKLLPLEEACQFHNFHSPKLEDPEFDAKPFILLVGQYSTGKTTFIKYLLERDFPGMRIGPEPTTDRFIAVMYDEEEGVIPGNPLVVDPNKQFKPLAKFGNSFLNRFQCSLVNSPVLNNISIVDTPGILSGEKHILNRGYDFMGVIEWFAQRADRIILLFDVNKIDILDEFRSLLDALKNCDEKIRIVLNKSDSIDHQQLMRVYGALMWSLGKVLKSPEASRVYIGSFWDQPLRFDGCKRLFEDEEHELFKDLMSLPQNATLRKLNEFVKRARSVKAYSYIVSTLHKEMPLFFGKDAKKKDLIDNLSAIFKQIQTDHQIPPGDFPEVRKMQETLKNSDFYRFHVIKPKLVEVVDKMLSEDIPKLMAQILRESGSSTTGEMIIKDSLDSHKKWELAKINENFQHELDLEYQLCTVERDEELSASSEASHDTFSTINEREEVKSKPEQLVKTDSLQIILPNLPKCPEELSESKQEFLGQVQRCLSKREEVKSEPEQLAKTDSLQQFIIPNLPKSPEELSESKKEFLAQVQRCLSNID